MEPLSRVKKFEKLRETIENETVSTKNNNSNLSGLNKELEGNYEYLPSHEKNIEVAKEIKNTELDSTFKNEYLDSFIQEVRDYNMKKGVREHEDTKLDILQQLSSKNREKRANYIEKIEEEAIVEENTMSDETIQISRQVFDLLNDDPASEENVIVEDVENREPVLAPIGLNDMEDEKANVEIKANASRVSSELEERIASLESQLVETTQQIKFQNSSANTDESIDEFSKRELFEETMKLKVQMDEYKEEITDINTGIDSNNRLLNIIITILILALIAVIGVVVYWLISGGII